MQKLLIFKRVKKNLTKSSKINTWVISDGTKGMENQSLAVAKLLGYDYELINYNPPYLLRKIPLSGKFLLTPKILKELNQKPLPKFAVSYTHLRSPRDGLLSRMPSSA